MLQFFANLIKKWGYTHDGHKALILLKYKVLNSIVLRCTKIERATDLALPPRTVCISSPMALDCFIIVVIFVIFVFFRGVRQGRFSLFAVSHSFHYRHAFDAREQDFYEALYTQSQSQFNT